MKVNILTSKVDWFGKYSGYECLPNYFPDFIDSRIYSVKFNLLNKIIGKIYKSQNNWNIRSEVAANGVRFLRKIGTSNASHILYLEGQLHLLKQCKEVDKRLIGTIHFPISFWKEKDLEVLARLENAIILYEEEIDKFERYLSREKLHVIKHGVDIDFFKPGNAELVQKKKVLFVGHFLRNFEMFEKVYHSICKEVAGDIQFHFIIPASFRNSVVLFRLSEKKNVFFHEKLSDEELLEHYQNSNVLLMPMNDSGANTAIVQALSTGLPVITTEVGGIKSYGGGDLFPIIENNDHKKMTEVFAEYYFNSSYRDIISERQRSFSVTNLDWTIIARQHAELYKRLSHDEYVYQIGSRTAIS